MNNLEKSLKIFFSIIGIIILSGLILALPLMYLWNWLMPVIFGLPEIGFWQALGLNILSEIFFRSINPNSND